MKPSEMTDRKLLDEFKANYFNDSGTGVIDEMLIRLFKYMIQEKKLYSQYPREGEGSE